MYQTGGFCNGGHIFDTWLTQGLPLFHTGNKVHSPQVLEDFVPTRLVIRHKFQQPGLRKIIFTLSIATTEASLKD
jgi:hypothetical protein